MDPRQVWQSVYDDRQKNEDQRQLQQRTEREGRILAIDGCFDAWGDILPHIRAKVKDLFDPRTDGRPKRPFRDYHVVALGCPGSDNPDDILDELLEYLEGGGFVLTTDWCLGHVLTHDERPSGARVWLPEGAVAVGKTTGDDFTVDYEVVDRAHPLMRGLPSKGEWTITHMSHTIRIVEGQRVRVLMRSRKMLDEHGDDTLLFTMQVGAGTLVHFVSHAYAQEAGEQGARAAVAILANLFDLATAGAAPDEGGRRARWIRLRVPGSDRLMTIRADAPAGERALTRAMAKALMDDLADEDGNPFYKYISPDVPILEFRLDESKGWQARVPPGSPNAFETSSGGRLGDWQAITRGERLTLFSTRQARRLDEVALVVEVGGASPG